MITDPHNLHKILCCQNSSCGFRFPVNPHEKQPTKCPRCESPLSIAEAPYRSFAVPEKAEPLRGNGFSAVLDNIRSAYNVGSIFRTADGAGIKNLFLCGMTPTPENRKVGKTSLGAEQAVSWQHSWSTQITVEDLIRAGTYVVALEGGDSAINIFDALPLIRQHNQPVALVVGNEVSGVDPEVVSLAQLCIYIPMEGVKESLNVASAFGIAAYLIRYQGRNNE